MSVFFMILSIFIINKYSKNNLSKYFLLFFSITNSILILLASSLSMYYDMPLWHSIYFSLLLLSFVIGYLVIESKYFVYKVDNDKVDNVIDISELIKPYKKMFSIIGLIIMFILVFYLYKYKILENEYGVVSARNIKFTLGFLFKTPLEYAFFRYIIEPFVTIITILFSLLILGKQYRSILFYQCILCIILYSEIGKGRFIYFDIIVYLFIFILFLYAKNLVSFLKKNIKLLIFSAAAVILLLLIMTLSRMGSGLGDTNSIINGITNTFEQLIQYFSGPYKMFSEAINLNYRSLISNDGIIFPILGGLDELIKLFFNFVGFEFITTNTVISNLTNVPIAIGNNLSMNAFYTGFFNFYLSGGIVGSIIISLIFGMFVSILHYRVNLDNLVQIMLVALLTYPATLIMLRWELQSAAYICTLFYLLLFLLFKKKANLKELKKWTIR